MKNGSVKGTVFLLRGDIFVGNGLDGSLQEN
jgi:hypothetical protein